VGKRAAALLRELPSGVTLVAAATTRTPEEVRSALDAGVTEIGHNYVQEAAAMREAVGRKARWHLIGHLQRNKARRAARLFDIVETIDSERVAAALSRHCEDLGKVMPVLIEVNSAREPQKAGVRPDDVLDLVRAVGPLPGIRVEGLMTMGPFAGDPEDARPYFRTTRETFERVREAAVPGVEMRGLSMGMSHSYRVAIEEGATIVRIGTKLFGPRTA
jgi:pyridoxal phosphate enzyme (YggS family)